MFSARTAVLDLDAIDNCKVRQTALHYIVMSGTYAGYTIAVLQIKVEDGATFVLNISPRQTAARETAIYEAWWNSLLGKVRAALTDIRAEYAIAQCPQCDLHGDKV